MSYILGASPLPLRSMTSAGKLLVGAVIMLAGPVVGLGKALL